MSLLLSTQYMRYKSCEPVPYPESLLFQFQARPWPCSSLSDPSSDREEHYVDLFYDAVAAWAALSKLETHGWFYVISETVNKMFDVNPL